MAPEELIGFSELIEVLGVSRTTAHRYTSRDDFPEPVERLARGRIWKRADVLKWKKKHLPLQPGRPRQKRQRR